MTPPWLDWAQRLQAIAQNGLAYAQDAYDVERFAAVREIAAEIMTHGAAAPLADALELFADQTGYATPKVDVRGVVFCGDAILMVKERADNAWTLPGGWADVGVSIAENVEREIFEESGFEARAMKLLAVYDRNKHNHPPIPFHTYKLFVHCELVGGRARTSVETDAVDFFRANAIPELSTSRVTRTQIARMFAHRLHPEWPTDFD